MSGCGKFRLVRDTKIAGFVVDRGVFRIPGGRETTDFSTVLVQSGFAGKFPGSGLLADHPAAAVYSHSRGPPTNAGHQARPPGNGPDPLRLPIVGNDDHQSTWWPVLPATSRAAQERHPAGAGAGDHRRRSSATPWPPKTSHGRGQISRRAT